MDKERIETINQYLLGVKNGDSFCLEQLYKEVGPTIRYIALKYLKCEADADDLVQDFWADIYKISGGFIFLQNGFSYLCKTMTRQAINRYKRIHRERVKYISFVDYEPIQTEDSSYEYLETKTMVESALRTLSDTEKIIIQMTYFEDKTVRDAAKELNISKSQLSKMKMQAIEKMKLFLEKDSVDKEAL